MVIWLTGCTSGIGRALVEEFTNAGHLVFAGARRSMSELSELYPTQHFYPLDVADEDSVRAFCDKAYKVTGTPNFLINNAAVMNTQAPLWEISGEEFDTLMQINVSGTVNMIRHTMPYFLKNDRSYKNIIVNLSSGWGRSTSPMVAPYCASKWAIEGLNQALSQEFTIESNVATVALSPGVVNTDMLQICMGNAADSCITPIDWAKIAVPFILNLDHRNNGESLTLPR